jgi:hypothetical protein
MNCRTLATALVVLAITAPAFAGPPTAEEIQNAARGTHFTSQATAKIPYFGKEAFFVPAKLGNLTLEELSKGKVVGRLFTESGFAGYVYFTEVDGKLKGYVESGGQVVISANDVHVAPPADQDVVVLTRFTRDPKPGERCIALAWFPFIGTIYWCSK